MKLKRKIIRDIYHKMKNNYLNITIINIAVTQAQDSSIKQMLVQAVTGCLIYCVLPWIDSCLQQLVQWLF